MPRKVKYPQLVSAEMHRFSDENGKWYKDKKGECYLVRNKTKIFFSNTGNLIGTVIMTNPGSYGLDAIPEWGGFKSGNGNSEKLSGYGRPDLTMQNIIEVIQRSYED